MKYAEEIMDFLYETKDNSLQKLLLFQRDLFSWGTTGGPRENIGTKWVIVQQAMFEYHTSNPVTQQYLISFWQGIS